jgi:hypothetical protein
MKEKKWSGDVDAMFEAGDGDNTACCMPNQIVSTTPTLEECLRPDNAIYQKLVYLQSSILIMDGEDMIKSGISDF